MTSFVTTNGAQVTPGALVGKGGEGTVYELRGHSDLVAKVYHEPLTDVRAEKILAMLRMATPELERLAAWPRELLLTAPGRKPIGLIMQRVARSRDVHNLYGPKSRLQEFPRADWRFLLRATSNIAKAFAVVHDAGIVIGDVNHGSVLVGEDATVKLVDCDSFQITAGTRRFLCEKGVETFTPPELQGLQFASVVQTQDHDNFRLAVLAFHLLFMGRHPFAGRYLGSGEMPLGRAIKEFRFAYSVSNRAMQMDKPPGTPPLSIAGTRVAGLFELAFSQSATSAGRPSARDWIEALEQLERGLKRCEQNHSHWYAGHLAACPWCGMEALGANALFPFVPPPGSRIDVDDMWKQVNSLPKLGVAPPIESKRLAPSPEARRVGPPFKLPSFVPFVIGWAGFAGLCYVAPPLFWIWAVACIAVSNWLSNLPVSQSKSEPFSKRLIAARGEFDSAYLDWTVRTAGTGFNDSLRMLEAARTALQILPSSRLSRLDKLRDDKRRLQLNNFLDGFEIEDARIAGVGPGKKRTLASYGVETAADVVEHRVMAVPGFGPKTIAKLENWRRSIERKFVFDASKAVDPRDTARVEQEVVMERLKYEAAAKVAFGEVMQRYTAVTTARRTLRSGLEDLRSRVDQAEADLKFVRGEQN